MATKLIPVSRPPALLTERDADKTPVLECIDLGITFGGLKAVDNFNVTIGRTEIAGLIGPNGAGKTTIFNLLTKIYQPVASYAFGAKKEERFHQSVRVALKGALLLTVLVEAVYILLSRPLILLFNGNPLIVEYGRRLLISQVALYPAFGLCYMMTITFQTIGASRYGLFLSMIRQGLFYVPFILTLPKFFGVTGICSQPAADVLTLLVCLCSIKPMKRIASVSMKTAKEGKNTP